MLIPAISKKYEIIQEFRKLQYTDDLMLEVGCCDNYMPNIIEEPNRETYQYAIVNSEDKLISKKISKEARKHVQSNSDNR